MAGTAAWIDVLPDLSGFNQALTSGATSAAKAAGIKAGGAFSTGMRNAAAGENPLKAQLEQLEEAEKKAERTVRDCTRNVAKAHDDVKVATLRAAAAQTKYDETVAKSGASSSQALNAAARLEAARSKLTQKTDAEKNAIEALRAAHDGLKVTRQQVTAAEQRAGATLDQLNRQESKGAETTSRFGQVMQTWRTRVTEAASSAGILEQRQLTLSDVSARASAKFAAMTTVFQTAWGTITAQVSGAVNRVDQLNNFPRVMSNLGYSSEDAAASIKQIGTALDGLPSSTNQVAGMVQQLAPLTHNLKDATNVALAFNDALLAGGAPMANQQDAMLQFTQMLSAGKVDMQAWRSVEDAMPGQLTQLSVALLGAGHNGQQLYAAMQSGQITFKQFNDAVVKLDHEGVGHFASFSKQAKDATGGIGTAMQNVKNRIQKALADIIQSIGATNISAAINRFSEGFTRLGSAVAKQVQAIMPVVQPIINRLMSMVESFTNFTTGHAPLVVKSLGAVLAAFVAFRTLRTAAEITQYVHVLGSVPAIAGGVSKAISGMNGAMKLLNATVRANPWTLLVSLLLAAAAAFAHWLTHTKEGRKVMHTVTQAIGKAWQWLHGVVSGAAKGMGTVIGTLSRWARNVGNAFQTAGKAISGVWNRIKGPVVNTVKIIMAVALFPLVAAIRAVMTVCQKLRGPVTTAWNGIRKAFTTAWTAINLHVIQPMRKGIQTIGDKVRELYTKFIRPIWDAIAKVFQKFGNWFHKTFISRWNSGMNSMSNAMNRVKGWITRAWDDISGVFHRTWGWIDAHVIVPFRRGIQSIGDAMNRMKDVATRAWNAVKDAAMTPVRFIVNTVYMNGIRKTWNGVADAVGLHNLDLPAAHFATGGVMPGYAPGVDSMPAMVSPGEAWMVPEWTRAVGADNIYRWNALARQQGPEAVRRDMGIIHFKDGGVWDRAGAAWSKTWHAGARAAQEAGDWLKGVASQVKDFVTDPGGWIKSHIIGPVQDMIKGISGGNWGTIVARLPVMAAQSMIHKATEWVQKIKEKLGFGKSGGSGGTGGQYHGAVGGGVEQWRPQVLQVLRELHQPASWADTVLRRMNQESGGNPNAINNWDSNAAMGQPSQGLMQTIPGTFAAYAGPYAGRGITDPLANIYAGCNYAINRYGSLAGMNRPGGYAYGGIVPELRPTLYDKGGMLKPGVTLVSNQTKQPELVLTAQQVRDMRSDTGARTVNLNVSIPEARDPWSEAAIWARTARHEIR